ncbi:MAG: type III-B CRISPR-associated protein Cas10/Cmr2 [Thiotrichales bacterium]|nr:type III-B CRISPR-associated protein Cas10/Cmr2 [Thiotrichales bacterium]
MTTESHDALWQAKLHARLHDPAEQALVLFRDSPGHDGGPSTSRALHSVLFADDIPEAMYRLVRNADWWACAADRPQLPNNVPWSQLRWTDNPILIHPLTGEKLTLHSPVGNEIIDVEARSLTHFGRLIVRAGDQGNENAPVDWQRTLLAYWRFGPEIDVTDTDDGGKLGAVWQHLPADTRIPDHSIWDHLDLTSAFAGAFAASADGDTALLALSIGPVQPFIAAARSTSDMWAGSHLLARISWEAMRVLCERLGPDAILFPRLRGIPQVDLWLRDECGLPSDWFGECGWTKDATDGNPLFTATLPNRFVAVVPADSAAGIAEEITHGVRKWIRNLGGTVVDRLLEAADFRDPDAPRDESIHAYRQMRDQLDGFPEVHWAAVPFSFAPPRNTERQTGIDTARLSEAMAPFFGAERGESCGFLASPAWQVLQRELRWDSDQAFYSPSPGVLYPTVYELAERVLAAAKAVRPFEQTRQRGWRCSLTGETEWLTTHPAQLDRRYRPQEDTLWSEVATKRPAWAKRRERLGALPAIKRLWPTLFAKEVGSALGSPQAAERFVVSTHTMALAVQMDRWLKRGGHVTDELREAIQRRKPPPSALPRRFSREHGSSASLDAARRLPVLLGEAREPDDEGTIDDAERRCIEGVIKDALGLKGRIESYYALLLMDGDRMGRILSGSDPGDAITYAESLHPRACEPLHEAVRSRPGIAAYLELKRSMSPGRHLAISGALNEFSLHVVPEVIEREHLGRVLYAGGDDVLAMLPAAHLLSAMQRLRYAYSGADPEDKGRSLLDAGAGPRRLVCKDGFASFDGRLMRMMGQRSTASCGAVVAHYHAPLTAVMRQLRAAEKQAKDAGRNRFSLTIVKRSGGTHSLTDEWGEPLALLRDFRNVLGEPGVSRRAVYNVMVWLRDMPEDAGADMLSAVLEYQLRRQTSDERIARRHHLSGLARRLGELAAQQGAERAGAVEWLESFLAAAEFLAREARQPEPVDAENAAREVA